MTTNTPAQVAVKPLDWHEQTPKKAWFADRYRIRMTSDFGIYILYGPVAVTNPFDSLEAAKAAAQADYEARIRSALIPAPAPAEQEPVAWPDGFYPLSGDARLRECTTDGCHQHCSIRMECGGVGSDYCEPCARKIAGQIAHPAPVPAVPEDVAHWRAVASSWQRHHREAEMRALAAEAQIARLTAELDRVRIRAREISRYCDGVEHRAEAAEAQVARLRDDAALTQTDASHGEDRA